MQLPSQLPDIPKVNKKKKRPIFASARSELRSVNYLYIVIALCVFLSNFVGKSYIEDSSLRMGIGLAAGIIIGSLLNARGNSRL